MFKQLSNINEKNKDKQRKSDKTYRESTKPTETPRVTSRHLRGALDPAAAAVVPAAPSVGGHAVRHRIGPRATQPASQLEGGDRAIVHAACVHPCEEAAAQWPL